MWQAWRADKFICTRTRSPRLIFILFLYKVLRWYCTCYFHNNVFYDKRSNFQLNWNFCSLLKAFVLRFVFWNCFKSYNSNQVSTLRIKRFTTMCYWYIYAIVNWDVLFSIVSILCYNLHKTKVKTESLKLHNLITKSIQQNYLMLFVFNKNNRNKVNKNKTIGITR